MTVGRVLPVPPNDGARSSRSGSAAARAMMTIR